MTLDAGVPELCLDSESPRRIGQIHGEALRALIQDHVAAWEHELQREIGLTLQGYLAEFSAATSFRKTIEHWVPCLLDEVRGIAEGANLDFNTCLALQCIDQSWWFSEELAGNAYGCSCLGGISSDGATVIGQNMDLPSFADSFQIVLRVKTRRGDELLLSTLAGVLALYGANCRGIAICVNTLSQLEVSRAGLPVVFVVRAALEKTSLRAARDFLCRVPHASGQNYLVGGQGEIFDLECSARGAVDVPPDHTGAFCHTNHPIVSEHLGRGRTGWADDRAAADVKHGLTFTRLEGLQRILGSESLSVQSAKLALAAVAHDRGNPFDVLTTSSGVFQLGQETWAHLASGPPGAAYKPYRLDRVGLVTE